MTDPGDDPKLPQALRNELFTLYRADVQPSLERDRAILNQARATLARRGRMWMGAAASVAAVVSVGEVAVLEVALVAAVVLVVAAPVGVGKSDLHYFGWHCRVSL